MLIRLLMVIFSLILVALSWYMVRNRHHGFLGLGELPAKTANELGRFALVIAISAMVSALAALFPTGWLIAAALILGAGAVGVLGLRLPKYMA